MQNNREREFTKHLVSGAGAGIAVSIVTCPLDVIKTRLQNQQTNIIYSGTWRSLRKIRMEEGIRGLYRGLEPSLLGYLPTWAIYFSSYDRFKNIIASSTELRMDSSVVHLIAACMAGVTSTTITSPLWVIRTRFMTQPYSKAVYKNTFHAFQKILKEEGFRGFYKGLVPSLIGISHVAVQFPLYEKLKLFFSNRNQNQELSPLQIIYASSISKIVASSITYPHEVIRTRLQNQGPELPKYKGIRGSVKMIYREEGIRGFYKGISANILRVIPSSACSFLTYELLLGYLNNKFPS